jgi:hypothetical protein
MERKLFAGILLAHQAFVSQNAMKIEGAPAGRKNVRILIDEARSSRSGELASAGFTP